MSDTPAADLDKIEALLAKSKVTLDPDMPYRLEKMFPRLEGWGAAGEFKLKARLVQLIEPTLRKMLADGEEVLYVSKGVQQSFVETMFMGAMWAAMLNQMVFVLTNARILVLRSNGKGKPKETFWMIYYSEIKTFKASWTGTLTLNLEDGRKMSFAGFPKTDRKAMPAIFEEAVEAYQETGFEPECSQSMEDLCSHCFTRVPKGTYECPSCDATFWKPSEIALRSLIFPSWGDFVLGHYALACFELLGYIVSWFILLSIFFGDNPPGNKLASILMFGLLLFAEHAVDAALTYRITKKGLHPKSRPAETTSMAMGSV